MKRCHDYGSYTSDGIIFLSEKFCAILVLNGSDTKVLAYPRPRAGSFHIYWNKFSSTNFMCQMYFDRANEEFLANNMDSFF